MTPKLIEYSQDKLSPTALLVYDEWSEEAKAFGGFLKQKGCRVHVAHIDRIPLFACDYLVIAGLPTIPDICRTILKKAHPKLLVIEDIDHPLIPITEKYLTAKSAEYAVKLAVIKKSNIDYEGLSKELFTVPQNNTLPIEVHPIQAFSEETPRQVFISLAHSDEKHVNKNVIPNVEKQFRPPHGTLVPKTALILGILVLLLSPILFFSYHIGMGYFGLITMNDAIAHAHVSSDEIQKTQEHFETASSVLEKTKSVVGPIGNLRPFATLESYVSFGEQATSLAKQVGKLTKLGSDMNASVVSNEPFDFSLLSERFGNELARTDTQLVSLTERIDFIASSPILSLSPLEATKQKLLSLKKKATDIQQAIHFGRLLSPSLPELFGDRGKRVYLVLFQNNMELRPGGGFIGSYGLATFEHGHMISFTIEDIYTADGQLKGHVDPPIPFRKYLSQEHWYMRDSNFSPDFIESSRQTEWFLEKETGQKVDGTIGVDLSVVREFVDALGGIELADFNERITGDNLFMKAQTYVQKDFFPGSTKKKDFLGSLTRALMREFTTNANLPWSKVAQSVKTALDEKHMMVVVHNEPMQKIIDQSGWSGRLSSIDCIANAGPCLPDYFLVSEANMGVNKSNAYLSRSFHHQVSFLPAQIERKTTITYENKAPSDVFPTGEYKTYVRLLIPSRASVVATSIDDKPIDFLLLDRDYYQDKRVVGFLLTVPPQQKKTVSIQYIFMPPNDNPMYLYQLYLQKQPGTEKDPTVLSFLLKDVKVTQTNFPLARDKASGYNPILGNIGGASTANGTYETDLSVDRLFRLSIN